MEYAAKIVIRHERIQSYSVRASMISTEKSRQANKSWLWDHDDPFLMHNNLARCQTAYGQIHQMRGGKTAGKIYHDGHQASYDSKGKEICLNFQPANGCHRPNCTFTHVCIIARCCTPHPCYLHNQSGSLHPQAMLFAPPTGQWGGGHGQNH